MTPKTLKMIFLPAMLGFMVLASGCASMFGDNTRTLTVNSEPQGAVVYLNNIQYGTTPATITLPNYIYGAQGLTFRKSGYQDQAVVLNTQFQPVGLWNILTLWGFGVDAATGDIIKLDQSNLNINVKLQPGN
jgi:hypothetical protein